jgi:hypothetical protein
LLATRKQWKESREEKRIQKIDAHVLEAITNPVLPKGPRAMTGSGSPVARSDELAQMLSMDHDAVCDSFERWELRGRVKRGRVKNDGPTMNHPSSYWHILHR